METKKILLVDDEKAILKSLSRSLRENGFTVTTADNKATALLKLKQTPYDIVITDLVMKGLEGIDVLKGAKKAYPDISVIILTGHGDISYAIDALRVGADDYLLKPCDMDELLFRLSRCLEKQNLIKEIKKYSAGLEKTNELLQAEITERKQTAEELRESEEKYRLLVENMSDGLCMVDVNGLIIYVNNRFNEMLGYSKDEVIGRAATDLLDKENQKIFREQFAQRKKGSAKPYELTITGKGGKQVTTIISPKPVLDSQNNVVGSFAVITDITERKQVEEALKESEEKYRAQFEASLDGIVIADAKTGIIIDCNPAIQKLVRREKSELIGQHQLILHPPEEKDGEFSRTFKQHLIKHRGQSLDTQIITKDGQIRDVSIKADLLNVRGKSYLWGFFHDITERKQAEEELAQYRKHLEEMVDKRTAELLKANEQLVHEGIVSKRREESLQESEGRYRTLFDQAADSVVLIDVESGEFANFNDQAHENLGYTRDEFQQIKLADFEVIESERETKKHIKKILKVGHDVFETKHRTKDGKILDVIVSARVVLIHGKKFLQSTWHDFTERKQAEEAVRKSEGKWRSLTENSPDIIWTMDTEFNIQFINRTVPGLTVKEVIGTSALNYLPEEFKSSVKKCFEGVLKTGKPDRYETEYRNSGDTVQYYEALVGPVLHSGQVVALIASARDVTERKLAAEALKNALAEVEELKNNLQAENIYLQDEIKIEHNFEDFIGSSVGYKKVLRKIEQVAPTSSTVLILGETGTGKELVARAVHNISDRKDRPLVKVNCAALPPTLIESALFGHEKGAFTGARARKIGRFELADGGTVFLDEIGDLPLELQAKLLRVLQEGEFERLGSSHTVRVDVRIIAATNRNLEEEVEAGIFRRDLYYRLNVFPIKAPPLRDRKDDIPLLVNHFVKKYNTKMGKEIKSIPLNVMSDLQAYHWPGNVRELENIIERAVILSRGSNLEITEELMEHPSKPQVDYLRTLKENERDFILKVLEETAWVIQGKRGAAARLGVAPSTLRDRMRKYGIKKPLQ